MEQQHPLSAWVSKRIGKKRVTSITSAVLIACSLLLSGCSVTPDITPSKADLGEAASNIMRRHIELKHLHEACALAGGEAEVYANLIYQQWVDKNWPLVIGADGFNRTQLQQQSLSFNDQTLSLSALKFLAEASRTAQHKVAFINRSRTNRNKSCAQKLKQFDAEHDYGLPATEDYLITALNSYASSHPSPPKAGDRVPTLAGDLDINSLPGRSLYAIERQVRDMPCPSPQIFTFKNKWPLEIYAAFCTQEQRLISCEWGNCSAQ